MSLADFSLADKKALVIGARRNVGRGFAPGPAEAGADVAITASVTCTCRYDTGTEP